VPLIFAGARALYYHGGLKLAVFALLPACCCAAAPACSDQARAVYRLALRSSDGGLAGFGGGVFVAPGVFLTARHIFEDAPSAVRAEVEAGERAGWPVWPVESVVASSRGLDIVLLRVRLEGAEAEGPPLGDSLRPGDAVTGFRIASPPRPPLHSPGIACTTGRVTDVSERSVSIRGDAFFVKGSSGSPVLDAAGRVAAIAIDMVDRSRGAGPPEWSYTARPIALALAVPRFAAPVSLAGYLARLRAPLRGSAP
jgi:S1-C subfamily serine protease